MRSWYEAEAQGFLNRLFSHLDEARVRLEPHWDIDHICFRVESRERYETRKIEISKFANLLIESKVKGRMISTFQLREPIIFSDYAIDVLELPAPKLGKVVNEGFEHIEVVCDQTFAELQTKYERLDLDTGGMNKVFNSELEIIFGPENIKFHHSSLASVVRLELQKKVWTAIEKSEVLQTLAPFFPLIAGTLPLGLAVEESDVDVLVTVADPLDFEKICRSRFSQWPGFEIRAALVRGEASTIVKFVCENIPFEIFGQRTPSVRQWGWKHFQIEERLLKLGGLSFMSRIQDLRKQGLETEPAFAKCLELVGDPYEELARLHSLSNAELHSFAIAKIEG